MVRGLSWRSFLRPALVGGLLLMLAGGTSGQSPHIPQFGIASATYRDLDGDRDPFPDSGETGRLVLTIRNGRFAYTGAVLVLVSSDPDVDCIPEWRVDLGNLAPGATVNAGSLDPAIPGLTFKVAAALTSSSGAAPARIDLCVRLRANEVPGVSAPLCFSLPADLDLPPGATQTWIAGPDGVAGTADDGTLFENFDVDRDGDGRFTIDDTFRLTDAGTGVTGHGGYVRAAPQPGGSVLSGVPCGGFITEGGGNFICNLDPDFPMDWHLHCPPGATGCLNVESGPCKDGLPGAACTYATPADGQKASSPPNSLHMGLHFAGLDSRWDTTHFRSLQAFVSAPVNLAIFPRPGDLQLSMLQIADLMDNNGLQTDGWGGQCYDCGDVQAQVDRDSDPAVDDWGSWEKLVPFQNVYDHVAHAWSASGLAYYCGFTPTDAGTAPPAPRGFHETMCYAQGEWSHCGSARGTVTGSVSDCDGPGVNDPSDFGVWVETRFDLSAYRGQRVRIRWIGRTWAFDGSNPHYGAVGSSWNTGPDDDGWWLDDIRLTGVLTSQTTPVPDPRPAVTGSCPEVCTDIDGDGSGSPGSVLCAAGPQPDCDDLRGDIHPGAPEGCNRIDNDCDGAPSPVEVDADGDGSSPCEGDCNDEDSWTGPEAAERNDGLDNQCPGHAGYGLIDELTSPILFLSQQTLGGIQQEQATGYQVARSSRSDFAADCAVFPVSFAFFDDPAVPAAGGALYYLARPTAPHVGSWGADSSGRERTVPCAP